MLSLILLIVFVCVALMLIRDLAPEPLGKYLRIAVLVFCLLALFGLFFGGVSLPLHATFR